MWQGELQNVSSAQIKKVKPYPFKADLKDTQGNRSGNIILLTENGVLLELPIGSVQPGDKVDVSFQLPVSSEVVQFSGVVVKVYNQLIGVSTPEGAPPSAIQRLEVHIRAIDSMSRNRIERFLDQIGQRARS